MGHRQWPVSTTAGQALMWQKNPLAVYIHCGTHCINLVMVSVASCSPYLQDPVQWVHEVGTLSSQLEKFKTMFAGNAPADSYCSLHPLCLTRWTVLVDSIHHILSQYVTVLETLDEYRHSNASTLHTVSVRDCAWNTGRVQAQQRFNITYCPSMRLCLKHWTSTGATTLQHHILSQYVTVLETLDEYGRSNTSTSHVVSVRDCAWNTGRVQAQQHFNRVKVTCFWSVQLLIKRQHTAAFDAGCVRVWDTWESLYSSSGKTEYCIRDATSSQPDYGKTGLVVKRTAVGDCRFFPSLIQSPKFCECERVSSFFLQSLISLRCLLGRPLPLIPQHSPVLCPSHWYHLSGVFLVVLYLWYLNTALCYVLL